MDFTEDRRTLNPLGSTFRSRPGAVPGIGVGVYSPGFLVRPVQTPINAMSALELDEPDCDEPWSSKAGNFERFVNLPTTSTSSASAAGIVAGIFGGGHLAADNDGNHSSEEELEEINNKVSCYRKITKPR